MYGRMSLNGNDLSSQGVMVTTQCGVQQAHQ
jgi:hypothetical protein